MRFQVGLRQPENKVNSRGCGVAEPLTAGGIKSQAFRWWPRITVVRNWELQMRIDLMAAWQLHGKRSAAQCPPGTARRGWRRCKRLRAAVPAIWRNEGSAARSPSRPRRRDWRTSSSGAAGSSRRVPAWWPVSTKLEWVRWPVPSSGYRAAAGRRGIGCYAGCPGLGVSLVRRR